MIWLESRGLSWVTNRERKDKHLSMYLLQCIDEERGYSSGSHLVAALKLLDLYFNPTISLKIMKIWKRNSTVKSAPPLPENLFYSVLGVFLLQEEWEAALTAALSWGGMLRVGEALQMKFSNLLLPSDGFSVAEDGSAILLLESTKTAHLDKAVITCPTLLRIVSILREKLLQRRRSRRHSPVWVTTLTYDKYCRKLNKALRFLKLEACGFQTHSFRRGAATNEWKKCNYDTASIAVRGRWQSISSLRLYLKEGDVGLWRFRVQLGQESQSTLETLERFARCWGL